jgi:hypothetical protein
MSDDKKKPKTPTAPIDPKGQDFDVEQLRLSADFASTVGVRKALVTVPVRKPPPQSFVRVHPDPTWQLRTAVLQDQVDRETYLIARPLWPDLAGEVNHVLMHTAIDRQGTLFVWPVKLPADDGRWSDWHRSGLEAAERAKARWLRVKANMSLGAYEIWEAGGELADPVWPDEGFEHVLHVAFRDRYIHDLDHPVLRRLRGEE